MLFLKQKWIKEIKNRNDEKNDVIILITYHMVIAF